MSATFRQEMPFVTAILLSILGAILL